MNEELFEYGDFLNSYRYDTISDMFRQYINVDTQMTRMEDEFFHLVEETYGNGEVSYPNKLVNQEPWITVSYPDNRLTFQFYEEHGKLDVKVYSPTVDLKTAVTGLGELENKFYNILEHIYAYD